MIDHNRAGLTKCRSEFKKEVCKRILLLHASFSLCRLPFPGVIFIFLPFNEQIKAAAFLCEIDGKYIRFFEIIRGDQGFFGFSKSFHELLFIANNFRYIW